MELHNSHIKKNASEIFETNAFDDSIQEVNNVITPVVSVEPTINVVRCTNSTTSIYTTPTDKDFYLTNIAMNCAADNAGPTPGQVTIVFTPRDGTAQTFSLFTETSATGENSISIQFPMRGVLLAKGVVISATFSGGGGHMMIAGYLGSDRS